MEVSTHHIANIAKTDTVCVKTTSRVKALAYSTRRPLAFHLPIVCVGVEMVYFLFHLGSHSCKFEG